jgi:TatD DNase family protein
MHGTYRNNPCATGVESIAGDCPLELIDTHCHLDLEPLASHLPDVLAAARAAAVTEFVVPGVHPAAWPRLREMADHHVGVHAAFGVHPMHAGVADATVLGSLERFAPGGIAIGETGLDPAYSVPIPAQETVFRHHIRLAVSLEIPLLIHCRKAFQRTLDVLRDEGASRVGGIMHAFSGSPEMAREFIRLGFVISLSATLTRPGALKPLRLARELPLEHLVLETDAPDIPPDRYRGHPNQPAWIVETLQALADLRQCTPRDVAQAVAATSRRVLHLDAARP